ncbi:MAG: hypothetical protein KAY24_04075 [Candidatus Eisenbacteria sp.]|nr:hypothetical protein [Candidatus Eisenbacteria bacterium]
MSVRYSPMVMKHDGGLQEISFDWEKAGQMIHQGSTPHHWHADHNIIPAADHRAKPANNQRSKASHLHCAKHSANSARAHLALLFLLALGHCLPLGGPANPLQFARAQETDWGTQASTALDSLQESTLIGSFRAAALYLAAGDRAMGARFIHEPSGIPVDLLRFDSVPQAMIWVQTLPVSDRGEPHTAEHLVLGKGKKGRLLGLTLDMSMGSNSAGTWRCKTIYHFHTAGGRQSFLELTYRLLDTLLHPDFTDEEIRREVAHLGVVEDEITGELSLEEKGTVYLEMVSAFEKPGTIAWSEVRKLAYGAGHPVGLESGGRPAAIRTMNPAHIRAFLERCYVPGETMGLIIGLPENFELCHFLEDLDGIMRKVTNGFPNGNGGGSESIAARKVAARAAATVPPFQPPADPVIRLLPFPSASTSEPGVAVFSWDPRADLSATDLYRLRVLWDVLAGDESSYTYRDLVDRSTRRGPPGITQVTGWITNTPGYSPMLWLNGLDLDLLSPEALSEVRRIVTERLLWVASLTPGSAELEEFHEKVQTSLAASRRNLIEQTDAPPRFGYRGTGDFWYGHLRELCAEPEFRKDLLQNEQRQALEAEMLRPNFWPEMVKRLGLACPSVCVAAYPDTSLPRTLSEAKRERLQDALNAIKQRYHSADEQEALRRYRTDFDARTAELELSRQAINRPGFLPDPPLTLDQIIDTHIQPLTLTGQTGLEIETPVCLNRFSRTSLVDVGLYFDVTDTRSDDLIYLPLLPLLISDLGCWEEDGSWLAYDALRQRLQREIRSLEARYTAFPREEGGRVELAVYGSGLGVDEARTALAWMDRLLDSAGRIGSPALPRLRDLVDRQIASLREMPLGREEDWVRNPVSSYRYQGDRIYLSAVSMFTKLHHLNRLSWRLREASSIETVAQLAAQLNEILERWDGTRTSLMAELHRMEGAAQPAGDLAAYLRAELDAVPDETLSDDLVLLYAQVLEDLLVPPENVVCKLSGLVRDLLSRGPVRAHLTGSAENVDQLWPDLDVTIAHMTDVASRIAAESNKAPAADAQMATGANSRHRGDRQIDTGVITENLRGRCPWIPQGPNSRPVYCALVLESSRNALFSNTAHLVSYDPPLRSRLLDYLASKIFGGSGSHGLFMQTWSAGLAYSNGVGSSARSGLVSYYAERCSDGTETIRFVTRILDQAAETLDGPFFLDYALANSFGDYRGGDTYISRGRAMADDYADGVTPERVADFKEGLLRLRRKWQQSSEASGCSPRKSGILQQIRSRIPSVLGPVLAGYGHAATEDRGAIHFMIAPEFQIRAFEEFLETREPGSRLVRLYPRDFRID